MTSPSHRIARCLLALAAGASATAFAVPFAADTASSATTPLNDTGMQQCVVDGAFTTVCAGTGQDGADGRDARTHNDANGHAGFVFAKVSADGAPLPHSAAAWHCVQDRVTGLLWEVNGRPGGSLGPRQNYTNWGDGRAGDSSELVAAVNARGWCGRSDWRLPTIIELQGLIDYGQAAGASIDANFFPRTREGWVWTSTGYANDPDAAWAPYFSATAGGDGAARRDFKLGVRLVSGPATPTAAASDRWLFDGDEATDTTTGLVWRRCAMGQTWNGSTCSGRIAGREWAAALAGAQAEAARTGRAWRLPNTKELSSIADRTRKDPAIDLAVFPGVPGNQWFWTSTPFAADPTQAWTMDFSGAYTQTYPAAGYVLGARLVRSIH